MDKHHFLFLNSRLDTLIWPASTSWRASLEW